MPRRANLRAPPTRRACAFGTPGGSHFVAVVDASAHKTGLPRRLPARLSGGFEVFEVFGVDTEQIIAEGIEILVAFVAQKE